MSEEYIRVVELSMAGARLQPAEADKLEKTVEADPSDADARVKLAAFYFGRSIWSVPSQEQWFRHIFWFIENRPDHELLGDPEARLFFRNEVRALFDTGKSLWQTQLERNPNSAKLYFHAANYLERTDWSAAFRFLEEAVRLEPANDKWKDRLAFACELASSSHNNNGELERAFALRWELLDSVPSQSEDRASRLADFIEPAYRLGKFSECETAARSIIEISSLEECSPADLHKAHSFIGLVQLRKNDVSGACKSLLASGTVGTYPTLATFGPSFKLARALLKIGERKTVLKYLEHCSTFWESGQIFLAYWWVIIALGRSPDLNKVGAVELLLPRSLNPVVRYVFSLGLKRSNKVG